MTVFLLIVSVLTLAALVAVLLTKMVLTVSHRRKETVFSLTIAGCGLQYRVQAKRYGLVLGNYVHLFKPGTKPKAAKKKKPSKSKPDKSKKKIKKKISFVTWMRIAKAGVLLIGRFLVRVKFDEAGFAARPVISNPALAGMAYGWGQAFYGVFPGLRQKVNVSPAFNGGEGNWSGRLSVSIGNRQIIYILYRFVRDLPIMEIIKQKFFKRGV